jgi:radical SAM superfamily enzyme YgiQ (UPF0313 family)
MSNEVILLSDIPNHSKDTFAARYAGPYVIKSNLISAGFKTIVLDWFRFIKDNDKFFEYFEQLVDEKTCCVGISTTFLYPENHNSKEGNSSGLNSNEVAKLDIDSATAFSLFLWEQNNEGLYDWFSRLRSILDKYNPKAQIVLGGARAARILQMCHFASEDYALKKFVDYILIGNADQSIVKLLNNHKQGKGIMPSLVKNDIKFLICNGMGWPDSKKFVPSTIYTKHDCIEKSHWLPLEVSRGCAFNCKFCYYDKKHSSKRSMQSLKDELTRNYETFGTTGYNITSDCFNDNRKFVGDWANMVTGLPFKIEWASFVRIDPFHKYTEMMDEMISSGFRAGYFGIETLCHAAGKAAGKGLPPDRVKELLSLLRSKGGNNLWITAYFIIGLPKETEQSLNETLDWLLSQNIVDEVQTSVLDVAPFIEELSSVVDFADHSKQPEKYGFTKLEYAPKFYWEHESMNLEQAKNINEEWREKFHEHTFTRFGGSAHGEYPRIRDLGLNHKQATFFMKTKFLSGKKIVNIDTQKKRKFKNYVTDLSRQHVEKYYDKFLSVNGVR